jgi:hypothetical protein
VELQNLQLRPLASFAEKAWVEEHNDTFLLEILPRESTEVFRPAQALLGRGQYINHLQTGVRLPR